MYAPPPDRPELQGQGTQFHNANPNRPELAGQYVYPGQSPPPMGQQPQPYPGQAVPQQSQPYGVPQQGYHPQYQMGGAAAAPPPSGSPMPGQPPAGAAGWQSGPVPMQYHEMDAGGHGVPGR